MKNSFVLIFTLTATFTFCAGDWAPPRAVVDMNARPDVRWKGAWDAIWSTPTGPTFTRALVSAVSLLFDIHGCKKQCMSQLAAIVEKKFPDVAEEARGLSVEFFARTGINVSADFFAAATFVYEMAHVRGSNAVRSPVEFPLGCTSFVTCDRSGKMTFGRNLDWDPAVVFRNVTLEVDWKGKAQYTDMHFLLDLGSMTGVSHGGFGVSVNFRDQPLDLSQLIRCATDPLSAAPLGLFVRKSLEGDAKTFDEAVKAFSQASLCSSAYITIGGSKPGQGVVLTKAAFEADVLKPHWLNCTEDNWYVVQANDDWWLPQPSYDDRVGLIIENFEKLGREKATTFDNTWETLSLLGNSTVHGVLNGFTVYTSVMRPDGPEDLVSVIRSL